MNFHKVLITVGTESILLSPNYVRNILSKKNSYKKKMYVIETYMRISLVYVICSHSVIQKYTVRNKPGLQTVRSHLQQQLQGRLFQNPSVQPTSL